MECILRMQERNFTDRRNGPVIINHGREVKDDLFSPSSRESSPTKPDKITLNNQGVKVISIHLLCISFLSQSVCKEITFTSKVKQLWQWTGAVAQGRPFDYTNFNDMPNAQ